MSIFETPTLARHNRDESRLTFTSNLGFSFVSSCFRQTLGRVLLGLVLILLATSPALAQTRGKSPDDATVVHTAANTLATDGLINDKANQQQPIVSTPTIEQLINQLDAGDFQARERAIGELAKLGEKAIGPLADKSFDCSAETQWRIKKTLEAICTGGAEEVFYKALGIIKIRFEEVADANPNVNSSLHALEKKWRQKRKSEAISRLRIMGATIVDPLEGADDLADFHVLGGNLMIVNGGIIEIGGNIDPRTSLRRPSQKSKTTKKPSEKELRSQINSILESDIDENRERVFGTNRSVNQGTSNLKQTLLAQAQIRNRIRANQLLARGVAGPASLGSGLTIEIGKKWKGDNNDLDLIRELENVESLSFINQSISALALAGVSDLAKLSRLSFDRCLLSDDVFKAGEWAGLNELEFKNFDIDNKTIESATGIPSIQMLTFEACDMQKSALAKLKDLKSLRGLQFKETEIDKSIFRSLAALKQITYVNLSVCKFQVADYKFLKMERPSLQIAYTAQAFFGVRGPIGTGIVRPVFDAQGKPIAQPNDRNNCSISDVIPDSGAHKAGIKIGDVIKSVNGQNIEKFEDLRLHIAQHQAGEKIIVTVDRDGKPHKLEVELTSPSTAPRF